MIAWAHPDSLPNIAELERIEVTEPCVHGNYWMGYYGFEESETEVGLVRCLVVVNVN